MDAYIHSEPVQLQQRWITASFRASYFSRPPEGAHLVYLLQALGRQDVGLRAFDARLVSSTPLEASDAMVLAHDDHLTRSYLWVLGAYEVMRIIHARSRVAKVVHDRVLDELYRVFNRLRIPLAKLEPAGQHKESDSHVAFPAINSVYGVAWQVAEDVFISRGELSDRMLQYLESLPAVRHD